MAQQQFEIQDQQQLSAVFGSRDRNLKRIRDELGVDIVVRDGHVRIIGDEPFVGQAHDVLRRLLTTLRQRGQVQDVDVDEALGTHPPARESNHVLGEDESRSDVHSGDSSIDLLERGRKIQPQTPGQELYLETIARNDLVLCVGPAGSGKTYLAVAAAIHALRTHQVRKIVLVRPAVEAGEKLGFLPGDMLAKVNPYLRPLLDALNDMLDFEQVQRYMSKDMIEILPLAFMRGRTLNETFIILDEGQNTTVTQMKMFLTRMGTGSRIVVTGDVTQLDLPTNMNSGLSDAIDRLSGIKGVGVVQLKRADIVRHPLVRAIVHAYDKDGES